MSQSHSGTGEFPPSPWPASTVDLVALSDLVPDARNARSHSAAQVAQIARSMLEFGWTNPVLRDENSSIIAGHGRVLAAASLVEAGHSAFARAPVMTAVGWTEPQKRAYIIADNKLAENAGWDASILQSELLGLSATDFDLSLLGFESAELRALMRGFNGGYSNPDAAPPLMPDPVSRPGDVWLLREHRLMCGSSTDAAAVASLLAGAVPHLMVTDPPCGVKYDPMWRAEFRPSTRAVQVVLNDDRADWFEAWQLFPGSVAYVWHGALHAGTVQASLERSLFEMRAQIIWAKDRMVLSRGHFHWQHEPCWYAVRKGKKSHWRGGRKRVTVMGLESPPGISADFLAHLQEVIEDNGLESSRWDIPFSVDDGSTGHSTQNPVECMMRPMVCSSAPGDAVYEPFSGSGSCIIAGELCGRRVLAMELNPAYVDVAVRRWQNFTGETAIRESDGAAFNDLAPADPADEDDPDGAAWA